MSFLVGRRTRLELENVKSSLVEIHGFTTSVARSRCGSTLSVSIAASLYLDGLDEILPPASNPLLLEFLDLFFDIGR
jgi:hypothetical protein